MLRLKLLLLECSIILSRVQSVIYRRAQPQGPRPLGLMLWCVIHCPARRQLAKIHLPCRMFPAPQSTTLNTTCEDSSSMQDVSGATVDNSEHNLRRGDNTSFFRRHSQEMQSRNSQTLKLAPTENSTELHYRACKQE